MRSPHSLLVLMVVAGVASSALAPRATAGTFEVLACDAAPNFANNSWAAQVTHGGMVAFTACPSTTSIMKGLGARTNYPYPDNWTVPTGATSRWVFTSPPGTAVVGIRANAYFERRSHRYNVGLSNGSQMLVGCPANPVNTGGTCLDVMSAQEYVQLPASSTIYTEVHCAFGPCPVGGGGWYGWASLTWVAVTVHDPTAPAVGNIRGDLWSDQWMSGTRRVVFDTYDNSGITGVRATVDGIQKSQASGHACDPTSTSCPSLSDAVLDVATTGVPDGKHVLSVEAFDRAGNPGSVQREILVDNTAPASPRELRVDGGDGWRTTNAFDVRWTNPAAQAAPILAADYRLCPANPGPACVNGSKSAIGISELKNLRVPAAGEWRLTLWLRDAAGNAREDSATAPIALRFDPDPPVVAIKSQNPEDPARILVAASDAVSGIARGEIEIRRRGADTWHSAPLQPESDGFSAMLDDERLRDGLYDLRARAWDGAGNEKSAEKRANGEAATLSLPLRVKTRLQVGDRRKQLVRQSGRKPRTRVIYVRQPIVRHGRKVRIQGRLTAPGGNPMAGAAVDVLARLDVPGTDFQPVATLTTSPKGRFQYLLPAGPSRVLRFRYGGAAKIQARTRTVHVRVQASSSMRADRRRVVNGEAVMFRGRVRGDYMPAAGKLMELQYFDRGKWRTFRTFHTEPSTGRWSYSYRFDGTRGTRTYRFRVRIPKENGYPFHAGRSRRLAVTVRGL